MQLQKHVTQDIDIYNYICNPIAVTKYASLSHAMTWRVRRNRDIAVWQVLEGRRCGGAELVA